MNPRQQRGRRCQLTKIQISVRLVVHPMKVAKILESYLAYAELEIVAVERTRSAVKALALKFGNCEHTRLSPAMIRQYRAGEGLSPATLNRELGVLRAALKHAAGKGLIRTAPAVQTTPEKRGRVVWLSAAECQTLIAASLKYPGCADFIRLTLTTGQRLSAVLALRWSQIDWQRNVVWFTDHDLPHAERRKGRGNVPISGELRQLLESLRNPSPFVLVNRNGSRYQDINREHWAAVTKAAGLDGLRPHDLRHTVATNLIREKVPLIDVSRLLGHNNTKITEQIYINHQPEFLTEAVSVLGSLINTSHGLGIKSCHS